MSATTCNACGWTYDTDNGSHACPAAVLGESPADLRARLATLTADLERVMMERDNWEARAKQLAQHRDALQQRLGVGFNDDGTVNVHDLRADISEAERLLEHVPDVIRSLAFRAREVGSVQAAAVQLKWADDIDLWLSRRKARP